MSELRDKKITVSAAPISGPERESSYNAGRRAGEEDRQAGIVKPGEEAPLTKIRRITEQYRTDHDLIGGLILRDAAGPIALAHADHETASHRLHRASAEVTETGLTTLGSVRERDAAASHITSLVNPEVVRPRRAGLGDEAPTASDAAPARDIEDAEKPPNAFRHILDRKLPKKVGWVVLAALAAAEGFLNIQAFAATGESSNASFVLAILVGIGVIGLAHRIGDCAADLLENRTGARGRSPARLTEVGLGVPALSIGIIGTALIRARYYAAQSQAHPGEHIDIPTAGLISLAFMLAAAAIAVSMAMRNPFADDLEHQDRVVADNQHGHQQAKDELLDAQGDVSSTAATLRTLCENLVNDYSIQRDHVRQCAEAYLDGYCTGAGVRIADKLPILDPPQLVAAAATWLKAHPLGTGAPPTLPFSSARPAAISNTPAVPASAGDNGQDAQPERDGSTDTAYTLLGDTTPGGRAVPDTAYSSNGTTSPQRLNR